MIVRIPGIDVMFKQLILTYDLRFSHFVLRHRAVADGELN